MRKRIQQSGITINAIAGTYVVFLGLDILPEMRARFRGFAIKRKDYKEEEEIWLKGLKTFKDVEPHPAMGETFSSLRHPFQGFQWSDYSAKPDYEYTYTIVAMYGDPFDLEQRASAQVRVHTEKEIGGVHSVFFNRGSAATQEYARRFQNVRPNKAGTGAYKWLSRGLLEAIVKFIERAGAGDALHGAIYEFQYGVTNEFQYNDILLALKEAKARGASVNILYDDVAQYESNGDAKGPWTANRAAVAKADIADICVGRANAKLMHNKFIILTQGGRNVAVQTGSTNLTENGIFGHSNLVHIVEDETVADAYMAYWTRLKGDPEIDNAYRTANMDASPVPEQLPQGTTAIFSPRGTKLDALNWYSKLATEAGDALFMTFAFGMHKNFKSVYNSNSTVLKMALMEKAFSSPKSKKKDEQDIQTLRNLPNVLVAIGNRIKTNSFDRWLAEMDRIIPRLHVYWIHTKYMLIDPLGEEPIVVGGSANFSKASTDTNDENMLVIKGDKRIADIYFGEYQRLFAHYSFRESVARAVKKQGITGIQEWKPQYLIEDDSWMTDYFNDVNDKTARCLRRKYFSGPMSE